jgi:hypothetical protein
MTRKKGASKSPSIAAPPRMVRLSPPFGLYQLFRPIPKDGAVRPTLNETYKYNDELTLRFSAREALAAPEQTLLLVLLELAQEQHLRKPAEHRLECTNRTEIGTQLWSDLHVGSQPSLADVPGTLMLSCSWNELHRRCGSVSTGGAITESRRTSLTRLCEVTVWETESTKTVRSGRLVSWLVADDQRVHVALNHRLASAILMPRYSQVLLSERLLLGSQTAMLVHAFLSTCLGRGKTMDIGYETLVRRLWPDTGAAVPPSTHRRRLNDVESALRAIGSHENWLVVLGDKVARATRKVPRTSVVPEVKSSTVAASSSTERSTVNTAREMTRASHFCVPSTSYAEQSFLKKLNETGHSPRNDVAGTIL